jgi:hypothetical protein
MLLKLRVHRNDSQELKDQVEELHYLHRYPDPRSLPFGYSLEITGETFPGTTHDPDGNLWGIIVYKRLQHTRQRGLFGVGDTPTSWQVLDLARVWISPHLQMARTSHVNRRGDVVAQTSNIFSQFVGLTIRRVQADWLDHHPPRFPDQPYDITLVVSYCELEHHDGTAYRASGFERWGVTTDGTKEIYTRRLSAPRKAWKPNEPLQFPLIPGMPILYR